MVEEATGVFEVVAPGATAVSQPGCKVLPVHRLCFKGADDKDAATRLLLRADSLRMADIPSPTSPIATNDDVEMGETT